MKVSLPSTSSELKRVLLWLDDRYDGPKFPWASQNGILYGRRYKIRKGSANGLMETNDVRIIRESRGKPPRNALVWWTRLNFWSRVGQSNAPWCLQMWTIIFCRIMEVKQWTWSFDEDYDLEGTIVPIVNTKVFIEISSVILVITIQLRAPMTVQTYQ